MGLRIGIDGRFLQDHFPGIGRFTFHLISELGRLDGPESYVVFYSPSAANTRFDMEALHSEKVSLSPLDVSPLSPRSQLDLPPAIRREKVDVFHSPHYSLPLLASGPLLCTIHDTIPLRDPSYMPDQTARLAYRLALYSAFVRSKAIVADSAAAREDLVRHLKAIPYRIKTVYLGVDVPPQDGRHGGARDHILYVGTNRPHKNLPRLIEAYARAGINLPLVVAGPLDPRYPEAQQAVESAGLNGRVIFLDHVDEERLEDLYRSAALFVFPSLAEGFGLPVLEAMARGVPVVTSDAPAIREVAGDAALIVPPFDTEAIASAMVRVLGTPGKAADMARRGLERAALFPWSRTARGYLSLYRQLGGKSAR